MLLSLDYYEETKIRLQNWNILKDLQYNINTLDYDLQKCLNSPDLDEAIKKRLLNYKNCNLVYLKTQINILLSELDIGYNMLESKEKEIIYLTYIIQLHHNEIIKNMYIDRSTYFRIRKAAIEKMSKIITSY